MRASSGNPLAVRIGLLTTVTESTLNLQGGMIALPDIGSQWLWDCGMGTIYRVTYCVKSGGGEVSPTPPNFTKVRNSLTNVKRSAKLNAVGRLA